MNDPKVTIICPHCQQPVSVDDALTHQIQAKFKQNYEEQLQREKINLWKIAQEKALEKVTLQHSVETKLLKEELEEKRKALVTAQAAELEIRKAKNKLDEEKRNFELEKQRQIDAERDKIRADMTKLFSEQHSLKDAEKDKLINDLKKSLEDAQRKAQQGSQQTQGEVLELELETQLKNEFPFDEIIPVAKGINGADIVQKVYDRGGRYCGSIAWESKRTKAWSDGWIQKLKDDQRAVKAEIAVIITNVLPQGITNFGPKDGIYITNYDCIGGVATILRSAVIQVALTKQASVGKNGKMEILWNYLTGTEFKQHMEAILESFSTMKVELEKEKRIYTKLWAKREKQIQRVLDNTVGLRGELEGVMGNELPQMRQMELTDLDTDAEMLEE
jgi:hypothetical protein